MTDEHHEDHGEVQPAGVPRRGWTAPLLVGLFFGTTCFAGWYAFRSHERERATSSAREQATTDLGREHARAQQLDGDLAACKKDRDQQTSGHAETRKTADDARAALDATQAELERLRAQRAETEARLDAWKQLTARFQKMIDAGKLKVVIRDGRMIVKLPERVLFPSGSAELNKEGVTAIREIAAILKQFPDRRFMVAGHTDNVPAGGKYKSNWELSTARAVVVTEHLVGGGMNAAKLVAAGYGPYEPITTNGSEPGRAENRRIEIVLLPNIQEMPPLPDAAAAAPAASGSAAAGPPTKPARGGR